MSRVYITGLGFITSIGNDRATVSESLRQLRHGIVHSPEFAAVGQSPIDLVGSIKGFRVSSPDPEDWVFPNTHAIKRDTLRGMSPHVLFAWFAVHQAIADAGLTPEMISSEDTGMYSASAGSPLMTHRHLSRMETTGVMRVSPMGVVAGAVGTVNFNLVAALKIKGLSCGFASACASSGHAMGFAYDEIRLGRQKRMIVIGAEDGNAESILPFASMRALSRSTDPDSASRPFDIKRDGFVGTGGATVLILESEDCVHERSKTPYAEVAGWGHSSDGYNVAISDPEGQGLARAMRLALKSSGLRPEDVDHINAHATSTPIGDLSEIKALQSVFARGEKPAVSSTKALTGHGLSLASAMEAGFTALAIREGFTPGSAHITELAPEAAGLNIPRTTLPFGPKVALSNSSGFGGANVCLALRKA